MLVMRTIALINQKGGCGKTTSSINLAACLAHIGQRTLLVDMDPQGHCAVGLAVPEAQVEKSMYDVLRNPGGTLTLRDITWQVATNFDLAPSNITLAALETELHGMAGRQDRLSDALERVAKDYDFCIIDCPPNVGLLTFNAMRACNEVVIPVETGYFSLHGLTKQMELLESLRKQCKQEIRVRILATLYDIRTKLAREVLSELREQFGEIVMDSAINFNTKLKEAASFGQPITEYDAASKGFKDFVKLARELMGPAPRMTLDVSRVLIEKEEKSLESQVEEMQETVREIQDEIEAIPSGVEMTEAPRPARRPASPRVIPQNTPQVSPSMAPAAASVANALGKKAEEIKVSAEKQLGVTVASADANRTRMTTQRKIEDFYGVRQVPEGILFVAHCPNARSVALAGEFNGWSPDRNQMEATGEDGTFRSLLPLTPGRYRYRLVVDGRWQADPHNMYSEPNPYGELDSIVEVV
jgi:chromosome partitioning protein